MQSHPNSVSSKRIFTLQGVDSGLTLGGLLTTLAEAEVLCKSSNHSQFRLLIPAHLADGLGSGWLDDIIHNTVMGQWSLLTDEVSSMSDPDVPGHLKVNAHDTSLLSWLFARTGMAPTLTWDPQLEGVLQHVIGRDPQSAIVVHLRNSDGDTEATSAADGSVWSEALTEISAESRSLIMLIGDEPRPDNFKPMASVPCVDLSGWPLSLQLYAAAAAGAYLGMASGMAHAALFSETPTVIFKAPEHHADQMTNEFGPTERVSFWRPRQFMVRHQPTATEIVSEWRSIAGLR